MNLYPNAIIKKLHNRNKNQHIVMKYPPEIKKSVHFRQ